MARYIDADKLEGELFRDGIAGIFLNYPRRVKFTIGEIRGMLKNERIAPTADVVEVVRCKDCKHKGWVQEPCHGKTIDFCKLHEFCIRETDFCSYGEKRSEGNA